jgi:Cof subfamily protein (haloacid dehalogenase superfamily)
MSMPRVRLIATDLDGTLLRNDGSVSGRSRRVLQRAQAAGLQVVLVSARHPSLLRPKAEDAGVTGLAVCSNGAIVYDPVKGTVLTTAALEPVVACALIEDLREAIPGISFAVELGPRFAVEQRFAISMPDSAAELLRLDDVLDALELFDEPVTKLVLRHAECTSDELIGVVQRTVGDAAAVTYSSPNTLEISHPLVNKGWGLAALCGASGIGPEEVVAFGDMPNDVAMLTWAGWAVAVANAHSAVLACADEVTRSNMHDGVAVVVERLLRDTWD